MAKIIVNPNYKPSAENIKQEGKYLFDHEGKQTPMWVWLEKKTAFAKTHPNGKPWIRSKEMLDTCNRDYISEAAFTAENTKTNGNGMEVAIKTAQKRVLGATGVQQGVVKYLTPESVKGYEAIVNKYTEAFKATKGTTKKIKMEDMTADQLRAYLADLDAGKVPAKVSGPRNFVEIMTAEDLEAYNGYIAEAREAKENAPKTPREHRKLTDEEKAERKEKRTANEKSKGAALLAALLAGDRKPGDALPGAKAPVAKAAAVATPAPVADDTDDSDDNDDSDDFGDDDNDDFDNDEDNI